MGINIEYRIGNRKVSKTEWERHVAEEPKRQIRESVTNAIRRVRCPEHGQTPSVRFRDTGGKMVWEVDACCEAAAEAAKRAVR